MKAEPQELPDNEDEYEEIGESISSLKISAIKLAIKAAVQSEKPREPENILRIARVFYNFITEEEEDKDDE